MKTLGQLAQVAYDGYKKNWEESAKVSHENRSIYFDGKALAYEEMLQVIIGKDSFTPEEIQDFIKRNS